MFVLLSSGTSMVILYLLKVESGYFGSTLVTYKSETNPFFSNSFMFSQLNESLNIFIVSPSSVKFKFSSK